MDKMKPIHVAGGAAAALVLALVGGGCFNTPERAAAGDGGSKDASREWPDWRASIRRLKTTVAKVASADTATAAESAVGSTMPGLEDWPEAATAKAATQFTKQVHARQGLRVAPVRSLAEVQIPTATSRGSNTRTEMLLAPTEPVDGVVASSAIGAKPPAGHSIAHCLSLRFYYLPMPFFVCP